MDGGDVQQVPGGGSASTGNRAKGPAQIIIYLGAAGAVAFFLAIIMWIIAGNDQKSQNISTWDQAIDVWNDTYIAGNMSEIQLDLDIVPSPKTGRDIDALRCRDENPYASTKVNEMMHDHPYEKCFFIYDNNTDVSFPTLVTDDRMLPTGNSTSRCLTLSWMNIADDTEAISRANIWENYKPMAAFPECHNYENQQTMWPDYVPSHGVDIRPWVQYDICRGRTDRNCAKTCEKKGGFLFYQRQTINKLSVTPEPICYGYKVLSRVCVSVEKVIDPDTERVDWVYRGGCFKQGGNGEFEHEKFTEVEAEHTYRLEDVRILILNHNDPYLTMLRATGDGDDFGSDYGILRVFGWLFFLVAVGLLGYAGFLFYKEKQAAQAGAGTGSQELVPK